MSYLHNLPVEIAEHIVKYSDAKTIYELASMSSVFEEASFSKEIWKNKIFNVLLSEDSFQKFLTWKTGFHLDKPKNVKHFCSFFHERPYITHLNIVINVNAVTKWKMGRHLENLIRSQENLIHLKIINLNYFLPMNFTVPRGVAKLSVEFGGNHVTIYPLSIHKSTIKVKFYPSKILIYEKDTEEEYFNDFELETKSVTLGSLSKRMSLFDRKNRAESIKMVDHFHQTELFEVIARGELFYTVQMPVHLKDEPWYKTKIKTFVQYLFHSGPYNTKRFRYIDIFCHFKGKNIHIPIIHSKNMNKIYL